MAVGYNAVEATIHALLYQHKETTTQTRETSQHISGGYGAGITLKHLHHNPRSAWENYPSRPLSPLRCAVMIAQLSISQEGLVTPLETSVLEAIEELPTVLNIVSYYDGEPAGVLLNPTIDLVLFTYM